MTKKTFIIAEAGANHNRDFDIAKKLIDSAVDAKCDAVKFQTYSSETLYAKNTPDFAGYKNINKLIKDIELPRHWQKDLKLYCDDEGIEFMSTPFDKKAVDELYEIGVKRFKIAGFEATDPRIVKYAALTQLPLIITAGIGVDTEMVQKIYTWVSDSRSIDSCDLTFLHGNNAYPTPLEDINLSTMSKIRDLKLPVNVGISDHTRGILVPPVAVALGATVVEKHFTLSRKMAGPDHPFAIEPDELSLMVEHIREVEKTLGIKDGVYTKSESEGFVKARRSVVSSCEIKKGETLTDSNITTKRPFFEGNIPAADYYDMIGKVAKKDISPDSPLNYGDV
jgi:N,N'-diacetyllegionaminate synthase